MEKERVFYKIDLGVSVIHLDSYDIISSLNFKDKHTLIIQLLESLDKKKQQDIIQSLIENYNDEC